MKKDSQAQDTELGNGTITPQAESQRVLSMVERMATDPNVDPAKLREILNVKQQWEADEARKAFASAMATFQTNCPIIAKGDDANGKRYAKIDRIHRETRALRKECGFWFVWQSCEVKDGVAYMEGTLGHTQGHTVPLKQTIPLPDEIVTRDGKRVQNQTQRAGSAMTYAKRYGECLALDIVTGEDDDGNAQPRRNSTSARVATDATRKWMIDELQKVDQLTAFEAYANEKGWLAPDEKLEQIDLNHVPTTRGDLNTLIADVKKWTEESN